MILIHYILFVLYAKSCYLTVTESEYYFLSTACQEKNCSLRQIQSYHSIFMLSYTACEEQGNASY